MPTDYSFLRATKSSHRALFRGMSDAAQIRDRASRLFALALKAREDGLLDYAEQLIPLASEAVEQATTMENQPAIQQEQAQSPNDRLSQSGQATLAARAG